MIRSNDATFGMSRADRRRLMREVRLIARNYKRVTRQHERYLKRITKMTKLINTDEKLLRAVADLMNLDKAWIGDPDDLREPLAALLSKAGHVEALKYELNAVVKILVG